MSRCLITLGHNITWIVGDFDFGSQHVVAGRAVVNGVRFRHAVSFGKPKAEVTEEDMDAAKAQLREYFLKKEGA